MKTENGNANSSQFVMSSTKQRGIKYLPYDKEIQVLFQAIRQLIKPLDPPRKKIGFKLGNIS